MRPGESLVTHEDIEIPVRIHLSGRTSIDYRVVSDEGNKIADQLTVDVVAKT